MGRRRYYLVNFVANYSEINYILNVGFACLRFAPAVVNYFGMAQSP